LGALHDEVRSFCFASPAPAAQRMDFEQLVIEQGVAHGASVNSGRLVVRQRFVGREVPRSAHLRAELFHRRLEGGTLFGGDRRSLGPQLAGRRPAPAVGSGGLVGHALSVFGVFASR
jgi:hypothetical protein